MALSVNCEAISTYWILVRYARMTGFTPRLMIGSDVVADAASLWVLVAFVASGTSFGKAEHCLFQILGRFQSRGSLSL